MAKFEELNLLTIGNTIQIAGAIYQGEGKTYLCFFPEDKADLPIEVLEMNAENWQAFLRQTDILEAEILTKASDGTLAKAIVRKGQRQIDSNVSWKVFRRDKYRCRYCNADNLPLTVDHLVRWEEGGPSTEANLFSCCKKCNRVRGDHSYDHWLRHAYYLDVSKRLDAATREANVAIAATLHAVPRMIHPRGR